MEYPFSSPFPSAACPTPNNPIRRPPSSLVMAPPSAAVQRPGMQPQKPLPNANGAPQQAQRPQNGAPPNANAPARPGGPPQLSANSFQQLHSTTNMMLQQMGYVLAGPGRIDDRRDTFNTMYSELYSRFQQIADRLEDDVCHAKQVVRGQYAVYLETQKRKKEEEEEQARKREKERELEIQREKQRELEAKAKAEAEKKKKLEAQQDIIMLDSPIATPQPPNVKGMPGSQAGTPLAAASTNTPTKSFNATFPVSTPPITGNDANATESTEFDFESLFGIPATSTDQSTAMEITQEAFPDPSADVASLIPGIENYASMDQSAPPTTTMAPVTSLDMMDFTMPDTPSQNASGPTETANGTDFSTANFDDDFMNFLNDTSGGDNEPSATDNDLDDWLKDMQ
jgi:hypothetical protein